MKVYLFIGFYFSTFFFSCKDVPDNARLIHDSASVSRIYNMDTLTLLEPNKVADSLIPEIKIDMSMTSKDSLIDFAKTLLGTPYLYGSANPAAGLDCSGFIYHVFNHFHIHVPRSSYEFTNAGTSVPVKDAAGGDLILFTGTDTSEVRVGHMGIVVENTDSLRFIHSSSGRANGVTITAFNDYYKARFVKVVRIFN